MLITSRRLASLTWGPELLLLLPPVLLMRLRVLLAAAPQARGALVGRDVLGAPVS